MRQLALHSPRLTCCQHHYSALSTEPVPEQELESISLLSSTQDTSSCPRIDKVWRFLFAENARRRWRLTSTLAEHGCSRQNSWLPGFAVQDMKLRVRGAEGGEGVRKGKGCDRETVLPSLQARSMVYHVSAMEYISSLQVIVAIACGWEVGISVHLCRCGVGPRDSQEKFAQTAGTSSKQSATLAFQRCCSLE
jgi:hypothetical protein